MSYELTPRGPELGRMSFAQRQRHLIDLRTAMGPRPLRRFVQPVRKKTPVNRYQWTTTSGPVRRPIVLQQPYIDGLGFSLKPPKFVRKAAKAVKKAVTLKRVLTAGAIVGGAVVLGPAALAVAKVAASGAGAVARKMLPAVGKLVRGGKELERAIQDPNQTVVPVIPPFAPNAPPGTYVPQNQPGLTPIINSADAANDEAQYGEPLTIQARAGNNETVMAKPVVEGDEVTTSTAPPAAGGGLAIGGLLLSLLLLGRR